MKRADVAIVGAGIVGVASALALLAEGYSVVLIDPEEPGAGTAAGSAGYLAASEIFPLARAAVVVHLPRMLADPLGPLVVRLAYAPRLAVWGLRFFRAMQPSHVRRAVGALTSLNDGAVDGLLALAERAGAPELIVKDGALIVCRSEKTLEAWRRDVPALREAGVPLDLLDAARLCAVEPALRDDLAGAVWFPSDGRCTDPGEFGRRLATRAQADGARVVRGRATELVPNADGSWTVGIAGHTPVAAGRIVVSAGVWSGRLLRGLGYRVPIEAARGYHLMLPQPHVRPRRVVLFGDLHFAATPMDGGLRLAGTVEFAGLDAPPDPRRSSMLYDLAAACLPGLRRDGATSWMGMRPSFPDSLPAIGNAPRHRTLTYCFGHEKLGLTQAATSARAVADLVTGRSPRIDLQPFSLERFAR